MLVDVTCNQIRSFCLIIEILCWWARTDLLTERDMFDTLPIAKAFDDNDAAYAKLDNILGAQSSSML